MNEAERVSKIIALKYRDFRLLWLGQLISQLGGQMQIVALNWQIYVLTHSAIALGLIGLTRVIPIIIFSLIGGTFADAHNRKRVLFVTQLSLTVTSCFLAITTLTHTITPLIIYILSALAAIAMSFDTPARQAFIPSLLPKKYLANAMNINMIMWQIASIVGPALAGFAIAHLGVGIIYGINAASFIAVIAALLLMQASGAIEGTPGEVSLTAIKEGLHFVRSKTLIWSTMILDCFSTFFASATALLPIFAKDILHVGPQGLGFLYAADSIGAVLTGYAIAHIGTIRKQGIVLLTAVALYGLGTVLFGLSHYFFFSFLALILIGAGDSISTIIRNTVRQLETPDHIRGRMTSINMIFFSGGPQLGEFESGLLASVIGAPLAVVTGGIGTLIVVGLVAALIPTLRNFDSHTAKTENGA